MGTESCAICGKRPSRYVCQECGRKVCERCLESQTWLCLECYEQVNREPPRARTEDICLSLPSMKILLVGFILIFLGMIILMASALVYGLSDSFGLVVFIGPIPIILGAGRYSVLAIALAVILTVASILLFVFWRKR